MQFESAFVLKPVTNPAPSAPQTHRETAPNSFGSTAHEQAEEPQTELDEALGGALVQGLWVAEHRRWVWHSTGCWARWIWLAAGLAQRRRAEARWGALLRRAEARFGAMVMQLVQES